MRVVLSQFFPIAVLLVTRFERSLGFPSNHKEILIVPVQSNIIENDDDPLIQESLDDISAKMKEFQKDAQRRRFRRPFVTLSYAQSIDGKIALVRKDETNEHEKTATKKTSSNFAISGPESLRLTHALRSIHDAILIGGNTLSVDNPRLNNRLWLPPINKSRNITIVVGDKEQQSCVVPVILDTHLHHIRLLGNNMRAQNPIVCCSAEAYLQACREGYSDPNRKDPNEESCVGASKESGVTVGRDSSSSNGSGSIPPSAILLPCKTRVVCSKINNGEKKTVLDLQDVLSKLHQERGIDSIMVEGGASVLSLFMEDTRCGEDDDNDGEFNNTSLFDYLCVTISPKLLGANGLDAMSSLGSNGGSSKGGAIIGPLKCITLGDDCVLFADRQK